MKSCIWPDPPLYAVAEAFVKRYNLDPRGMTGESYVDELADIIYGYGEGERAGQRLLKDFRHPPPPPPG